MAKSRLSVALVVLGLVATSSPAQQFPFIAGGQGGQGAMPEPMPLGPTVQAPPMLPAGSMPPGMMGGPAMSDGAGPGPMYPGPMPGPDHAGGVPEGYGPGPNPNCGPAGCGPAGPPGHRLYMSLGYQALQRSKLPNRNLATLDAVDGGVDTGNPVFINYLPVMQANDIQPHFSGGVKAMIGLQVGDIAYEVTGFYNGQVTSNAEVSGHGIIDVPFYNAPVGFEGNNGMWLQADVFRATLQTAIGSIEFDRRRFFSGCKYLSYTCGLRYMGIYERFTQFTGDDDLTSINAFTGLPDPTKQAAYVTTVHNNIIAPQLGLDYTCPLGMWLAVNAQGKAAPGVNIYSNDILLERGDGFVGRQGSNTAFGFSSIFELGFNLDVYVTPHARFRAGYELLWAVHVATAINQVDYNLAEVPSANNSGNMFFHGPSITFDWVW